MQIIETLFDVIYLLGVTFLGVLMIIRSGGNKQYRLFGIMSVVLGCGDAFHLVPRVAAMWTTGLDANTAALGFGKFITSITMTVFYLLLYHIWKMRYKITGARGLTAAVFALALARIALCFAPQNQWLSATPPLSWSLYRNLPFAVIGILIIVLFYWQAKVTKDKNFRFMWLAVTLSFAFYAPVVLFAELVPAVGALMMPKTCAYVWIVWMGYREMKGRA